GIKRVDPRCGRRPRHPPEGHRHRDDDPADDGEGGREGDGQVDDRPAGRDEGALDEGAGCGTDAAEDEEGGAPGALRRSTASGANAAGPPASNSGGAGYSVTRSVVTASRSTTRPRWPSAPPSTASGCTCSQGASTK